MFLPLTFWWDDEDIDMKGYLKRWSVFSFDVAQSTVKRKQLLLFDLCILTSNIDSASFDGETESTFFFTSLNTEFYHKRAGTAADACVFGLLVSISTLSTTSKTYDYIKLSLVFISILPSIHPSIHPYIHPSIHPSSIPADS